MDCASAGLGGQVVACVALGGLYCKVGAITAPSNTLVAIPAEMLVCLSTLDSFCFAVPQRCAYAASCIVKQQCAVRAATGTHAIRKSRRQRAVPLLAFNSVSESNRAAARRRRERPCGAPPLD